MSLLVLVGQKEESSCQYQKLYFQHKVMWGFSSLSLFLFSQTKKSDLKGLQDKSQAGPKSPKLTWKIATQKLRPGGPRFLYLYGTKWTLFNQNNFSALKICRCAVSKMSVLISKLASCIQKLQQCFSSRCKWQAEHKRCNIFFLQKHNNAQDYQINLLPEHLSPIIQELCKT